jgi:hypothetical protein
MRISLAEVTDVTNISTSFKFKARISCLGNVELDVWYTSPYFGNKGAGFVFIPSEGQSILVLQPEGEEEFYYIGTVLEESAAELVDDPIIPVEENIPPNERVDSHMYSARGKPQRLLFKDPFGNKLLLSQEYNDSYFNLKNELKSSVGKQVSLVDTPGIDSLIIKNQHGDGFVITSSPTSQDPSRSIRSYAHISQEHRTALGRYLVHLGDGRDITIVNTSTGQYKEAGDEDDLRYGNINLESRNKDINIYSRASKNLGKIHIECTDPNSSQIIQVRTRSGDSTIRVDSNNKIEIRSANDLHIEVGGNLNLRVGGKLSIEAGGRIDMKTSGQFNLDGATIDLNSQQADPDTPTMNPVESSYPNRVQS